MSDDFQKFDKRLIPVKPKYREEKKKKCGFPKFKMTLRMTKFGVCEICERKGVTDFMHILDRDEYLVNEPRNIIEGCKLCHAGEDSCEIMRTIAEQQVCQYGEDWLDWLEIQARRVGKRKWIQLALEMKDEIGMESVGDE
jgi:hypothetical protein